MFAFSQIDPRTNGQVTDMEVPLSRYLGASAAEGRDDSMFSSAYKATEMGLENMDPRGKILSPEDANHKYGLPGLSWDRPVRENIASLLNSRHQAKLDRAYFLSQDNHSVLAGAIGMGTQMFSSLMNPLDLGALFIPFVGEEKLAASASILGRGALRRSIAHGLITREALHEIIPAAPRITESFINGMAYQGMAQTGIIANRMQEGGKGADLSDLESIGIGGLFAAGMHLGISGLARLLPHITPEAHGAMMRKAMDDFAKGQDVDVVDIAKSGLDPERVVGVALKDAEGGVHAGQPGEIHPTQLDRLKSEGKIYSDQMGTEPLTEGFITNHGNFLSREDAAQLVGREGKLDSIQMSGTDEVNFGTPTRLARAGDVDALTRYLLSHGSLDEHYARAHAMGWIEKERQKDITTISAAQSRENDRAKSAGKILQDPVIRDNQGHSATPEDSEISKIKEDAAELKRQLEELHEGAGVEEPKPELNPDPYQGMFDVIKKSRDGGKTNWDAIHEGIEWMRKTHPEIPLTPELQHEIAAEINRAEGAMHTDVIAADVKEKGRKGQREIKREITQRFSPKAVKAALREDLEDALEGSEELREHAGETVKMFRQLTKEEIQAGVDPVVTRKKTLDEQIASMASEATHSKGPTLKNLLGKDLFERLKSDRSPKKHDLEMAFMDSRLHDLGYDRPQEIRKDWAEHREHVYQEDPALAYFIDEHHVWKEARDVAVNVNPTNYYDTYKTVRAHWSKFTGENLANIAPGDRATALQSVADKYSELHDAKRSAEELIKGSDDLKFVPQKGALGRKGYYTINDSRVSGFSMHVEPTKITLLNLSVSDKGKGVGGQVLERVKQFADEEMKPVELVAAPNHPNLQARLNKFYESHDFKNVGDDNFRYDPKEKFSPVPDSIKAAADCLTKHII